MIKKLKACVCFCSIPLILWGCSKNISPVQVSESTTIPTVGSAMPNNPTGTNLEEKDYGEIGSKLQAEEIGYIMKNGILYTNVIELLGEPESKSEQTIWGADGLMHQEWSYAEKGIELGMVRNDKNEQYAGSITMSSPCVIKTSRGIGIGSSKEDVMKAYAYEINPTEVTLETDSAVAGTLYGGLVFSFQNNQVTRIFIGAAAE